MMRKCIHIAVNGIFACLMMAAASLLVLKGFGFTAYSIKTPSMYPSCPVGTMIFVAKTDFDGFEAGDIVTFRRGDATITHRVYSVEREARGLITKGDNNDVPDGVFVSEEDIIGKVVWTVPYAGFIYLFAETTVGKIGIVSLFVFLAVLAVLTDPSDREEEEELSESQTQDHTGGFPHDEGVP